MEKRRICQKKSWKHHYSWSKVQINKAYVFAFSFPWRCIRSCLKKYLISACISKSKLGQKKLPRELENAHSRTTRWDFPYFVELAGWRGRGHIFRKCAAWLLQNIKQINPKRACFIHFRSQFLTDFLTSAHKEKLGKLWPVPSVARTSARGKRQPLQFIN